MNKISIQNESLYKIIDENEHNPSYGTNQDWYRKRWQRMTGCGPSAVTNLIYYLNRTRNYLPCCSEFTKVECLNMMNEIWNFVTPGLGGIASTGRLCKGIHKYIEDKKLQITPNNYDIPRKQHLRPAFHQVIEYLNKALSSDIPIAFLNLDHGLVLELESWHWVTIISMEYDMLEKSAFVRILDGGEIKKIDLALWLNTTKLGGGFVSFE